jgi:hypothetical protein
LHWNGQGVVDREIKGLKRRLEELGFSVRPLGVREGLAEKVPEDADVVLVLGPHQPFHAPEADALGRYVDAGGSVLIAMEPIIAREGQQSPQPDPLEMLVEERMGLTMGEGVLAAEQGIVPITHNKLDRLHLVTNAFTSHASTRTIAELASQLWLFMPAAGHLEQAEGHAQTVTFTVRSLAVAWADLEVNGDFEEDKGESKGARNVVAAVEGGSDGAPWRAVTTSDASMFSDLAYGSQGNQLFVDDTIRWLIGAEALSGTTENEEDVKIEHTKEGQTTWFYLTVLGIPLGVLLLGALRIRMRRKPGKRAAHDQADDQADDPAKDLGGEA